MSFANDSGVAEIIFSNTSEALEDIVGSEGTVVARVGGNVVIPSDVMLFWTYL